jgi:hypothetical protein
VQAALKDRVKDETEKKLQEVEEKKRKARDEERLTKEKI